MGYMFCFFAGLVIFGWMSDSEKSTFFYLYKSSWTLFWDAVEVVGNNMILLGIVFFKFLVDTRAAFSL